jgi:putative SOS response-associated peptidase YedK
MCNRFRTVKEWSQLPRDLARTLLNYEYNPNVAPTEQVPAFLAEKGTGITPRLARFGISLPPKPGKKPVFLLNVRTDSLRRGSFRSMLSERRAAIPADGFYEWREEKGRKQPYFFYRKDGLPILFAGIWDFSDVAGDRVPSFAILTDAANKLIAPYHQRMPVVLENPEPWLQESENPLDRIDMLTPEAFAVRSVNPALNRATEKNLKAIETVHTGDLFTSR